MRRAPPRPAVAISNGFPRSTGGRRDPEGQARHAGDTGRRPGRNGFLIRQRSVKKRSARPRPGRFIFSAVSDVVDAPASRARAAAEDRPGFACRSPYSPDAPRRSTARTNQTHRPRCRCDPGTPCTTDAAALLLRWHRPTSPRRREGRPRISSSRTSLSPRARSPHRASRHARCEILLPNSTGHESASCGCRSAPACRPRASSW